MWPISELMTVNMLSSFFSLFFKSDFSTDIVIQTNIKVLEQNVINRTFEFLPNVIEMANALRSDKFSEKFMFGAASSAYQVEGVLDSPKKGLSVWDYWTHKDDFYVADRSNGDIACDSLHKYVKDIELIKHLGADVYRISLSWSRILPKGVSNFVSPEGIRYYNELINTMVLNNVMPMVTIHQFDIPHKLQLMGGWTNPNMIEYFTDYAKVAFNYFGDRVKHWITINDPWELCNMQFGDAYRPYYNDSAIGNYLCGHHTLLAHAKVYQMYRKEFHWLQNGKVGISIGTRWFEPFDPTSLEDIEATEISYQFANYWFLNPLLSDQGNYPEVMRIKIGIQSTLEHFKYSRLPIFTAEEVEMIKQSLDFLGINFFTTYSANAIGPTEELFFNYGSAIRTESLKNDMTSVWYIYEEAYGAFDIKNTAQNFRKLLTRLNDDYILPQVYITANGYADFGEIYDVDRATYHVDHIAELYRAMKDGIDIRGYIAWSLMDSFEWTDGYSKRFGLYAINFNDPNRTRKEKFSTNVIREIYGLRSLPGYQSA